jgi:hypothetical protein
MRICLSTSNTLRYPQGGVLWVFLNWALGLKALGHEVVWFDVADAGKAAETQQQIQTLKERLRPYAMDEVICVATRNGEALPEARAAGCLDARAAAECDLLLDFRYDLSAEFVGRFRRSAYVDIDPGILQLNIAKGHLPVPTHDVCFTIVETVGREGAMFPDVGRHWIYTPPCVALDWWPVRAISAGAPFTTVSHWYMDEWIVEADGSYYKNDKRSGFQPFLDLPGRVKQPLELAICLAGDRVERDLLTGRGWRVREAHEAAGTAEAFHDYVQQSAGEFGCAKPAYVKYQTAWLSDRTICYLASGRPCIVQNTGASRFLPRSQGLFRFETMEEAVGAFEAVAADPERHARAARKLAEEFFDARKVASRVLEASHR